METLEQFTQRMSETEFTDQVVSGRGTSHQYNELKIPGEYLIVQQTWIPWSPFKRVTSKYQVHDVWGKDFAANCAAKYGAKATRSHYQSEESEMYFLSWDADTEGNGWNKMCEFLFNHKPESTI